MLQYMPWGIMWIGTGTDLRLPAERVLFPVFCLRVLLANGSDSSGSSKHGGCAMLRHHTEKGPRVWSPHRFALRKQQLLIASDCINETNILRKHRKNCSILCLKKKNFFLKKSFGGKSRILFPTKKFCAGLCCKYDNFHNILDLYTGLPMSGWISTGVWCGRGVNIKSRMCLKWRVAWKGAWVADGQNVWQRKQNNTVA